MSKLFPSYYRSLEGISMATRWQLPTPCSIEIAGNGVQSRFSCRYCPGGLTPPRIPTRNLLGRSEFKSKSQPMNSCERLVNS